MTDRKGSVPTTAERLGRMLTIVPYLVKHPGTGVAEAAALFDVDPGRLRRDLELLQMAGLPPYLPGDLIEVDIEADDTVWITMAEQFARPLRLTRQEARAIRLRAAELMATPGVPEAPDLASALEKLDAALGESPLVAAEGGVPPAHLGTVREAVAGRRRLQIGYVDAAGELSDRRIEPESVFADTGNWYAVVWDVDAADERLLRVDRILTARETGDAFDPRGLRGAGRPLYTPGPADVTVRLHLLPGARWVAEYYATTAVVEGEDGSVDADLPTRDPEQIARLILRLGTDAEVLDPPIVRELVRELAGRALAAYDAG